MNRNLLLEITPFSLLYSSQYLLSSEYYYWGWIMNIVACLAFITSNIIFRKYIWALAQIPLIYVSITALLKVIK